jgi:hypothetical protein
MMKKITWRKVTWGKVTFIKVKLAPANLLGGQLYFDGQPLTFNGEYLYWEA